MTSIFLPTHTTATSNLGNACIGLFGTCGTTTWREKFINTYNDLAIPYYNPQVAEWTPELAQVEARHLLNDDIVLFPVTAQTYGTGSLAETGFSVLQVLKSIQNAQSHRKVIVYIEQGLDSLLVNDNPVAAKESMRARALVSAHLEQIKDPNVYVVKSMSEMLMLSIRLYPAVVAMKHANESVIAAQKLIDGVHSEYATGLLTELQP